MEGFEGLQAQAGRRAWGADTWLRAAYPLMLIDGLAVIVAWLFAASLSEGPSEYAGTRIGQPIVLTGVVALVLAGNAARRLYAEAMADRALELVCCARSCFLAAIVLVVAGEAVGLEPAPKRLAGAIALGFVFLIIARSGYRARMTAQRRANEAVRPALVVGTNDEAFELCRLLDQDSAFGYRPWGVVGNRADYDRLPFAPPWLGDLESVATVAAHFRIDQVFVARTALTSTAFTEMTRTLTSHGIRVAAGSGLPSIDQRRLKIMAIAQMPMYCLGAGGPTRRDALVKRTFDITVALLALVALSPVMALTALAIWLADGRPIFFRQQRVGRHGVPFTIYKFRTMVRDADVKIVDLLRHNERQGPLFKLTADPRATRLGGFLRGSSLDELPQLVNVLQGKMSLVGPRPALVTEVERFSKELLARNGARPGMTGLWQVDAGDDPSFVLYQHLDLYYVDNGSFALDLAILLATIPTVAWRTFDRLIRARRKLLQGQEAAGNSTVPEPAVAERERRGAPSLEPVALVSRRGSRSDVAALGNGRASVPLGLAFVNGGLSVTLYNGDLVAVEMINGTRMALDGDVEHGVIRRSVTEGCLRASADAEVIAGAESIVLVQGAVDPALGQIESSVIQVVEAIRDRLRDGQLLVPEKASAETAAAPEVLAGPGLATASAQVPEGGVRR